MEVLDLGLGTSPFSDGVASLIGPGKGAGSWIIRTSSLLCWPRCCLAKSKPFTLGACSCEKRTKTRNRNSNDNEYKGFGSDLQTMATGEDGQAMVVSGMNMRAPGKRKRNSPQFCHLTRVYDTQFKIPNQ